MKLALPAALRERIAAEARAALPRECCGLVEGVRASGEIRVTALHPTRNLSPEPGRFEIDPAEQFRLMREGREIVGCYHSHPNGLAKPSPRDVERAGEQGFVWIVAAAGMREEIGAFVWDGAQFRRLDGE